jgi:hypothetical protein
MAFWRGTPSISATANPFSDNLVITGQFFFAVRLPGHHAKQIIGCHGLPEEPSLPHHRTFLPREVGSLFRRFDAFEAAEKARRWMLYQSPDDRVMVAQLPTSDWRDEQYVMGYGLYVNMIVYAYLRLYGELESAEELRGLMCRLEVSGELKNSYEQEALVEPTAPYYALYSYKVMSSDRFDLLGNSLAILTGIASPQWATNLLTWIEAECEAMRGRGELSVDLPPCLFPYILPHHADWLPRYERYNRPGDYHNGGVWPFVCGFYVSACVAAGQMDLAERKLLALTQLVKPWHENAAEWGFNEWIHAQTGKPSGRDWQTWSAAMYLYAAECVLRRSTPFFDGIREGNLCAAL